MSERGHDGGGETGTCTGRLEICGEEMGCAVAFTDLGEDGFGVLLLLPGVGVTDGDMCALSRECQGDGAPDSSACAGRQGPAAGEVEHG